MDLSGTLGPGAGAGRVLTAWKPCLLMIPNNTTSRVPSSLSKPFAVIRSFSVLSRGLFAAAASQEMERFSSDTALAWPGSGSSPSCRSTPWPVGRLPPPPPHGPGRGEGESPPAMGAEQQLVVYLHAGSLAQDFQLCWVVSEAVSSCLRDSSENCPPGKRLSNSPRSWKAAAQGLAWP